MKRKGPGLPVSVQMLRESNPNAFIQAVITYVKSIPAHPDFDSGWWCIAPDAMRELLVILASDAEVARPFRKEVSDQISLCRKCAVNYHRAVDSWVARNKVDLKEGDAEKAAQSLLAWDVKRLVPVLIRATAAWKSNDNHSAKEASRVLCREAFLEILYSVRLCLSSEISDALAAMFRVMNPLRENELEGIIALPNSFPPGIYALCFHPAPAVRGWAERFLYENVSSLDESSEQLDVLLDQLVARLASGEHSTGGLKDSSTLSYCTIERVWEGFALLFSRLQTVRSLLGLLRKYPTIAGSIMHVFVSDDCKIVKQAIPCFFHMLEVFNSRLWVSRAEGGVGDLTPESVIDLARRAYTSPGGTDEVKRLLLNLFEPLLDSFSALSEGRLKSLFETTFDFLCHASQAPAVNVDMVHMNRQGEKEIRHLGSAVETGTAHMAARVVAARVLLRGYHLTAPHPPLQDTDKIAAFVLLLLRQADMPSVASTVLRTVLLTDAMNIARACTGRERSAMVVQAMTSVRPPTARLTAADLVVYSDARAQRAESEPVVTWVKHLWKMLREGNYRPRTIDIFVKTRYFVEGEVLLEVHRCVGVLNAALIVRREAALQASSDSSARTNSGPDVRADEAPGLLSYCLGEVMDTVLECVKRSSKSIVAESWWQHVPFHVAHLLSSSCKEIRGFSFDILKKLTGSRIAIPHTGAAQFVARLLGKNPEIAPLLSKGCVSAMQIISFYGPQFSLSCYLTLSVWYRTLLLADYGSSLRQSLAPKWALTMVRCFLHDWRHAEQFAGYEFVEVTSRFLRGLPAIWTHIYVVDVAGGVAVTHLERLVDALMSVKGCQHPVIRASWVHAVCEVTGVWAAKRSRRDSVSRLLRTAASDPTSFTLEQCQALAKAFQIQNVDSLWGSWRGAKKPPTPTASLFPAPVLLPVRTSTVVNGGLIKKPTSHQSVFRASPQFRASSSVAGKNVRDRVRNNLPKIGSATGHQSSNPAPGPRQRGAHAGAARRPKKEVVKGPTKMELMVAKAKAARESGAKGMLLSAEARRIYQQQVLAEQSEFADGGDDYDDPNAHLDAHQTNVDCEVQGAVKVPRLDPARRPVRERHREGEAYPKILDWSVDNLLSNERVRWSSSNVPTCFETAEVYVQYWQPIVLDEFRASVVKALEEERTCADQSTSVADGTVRDSWICRTPFVVKAPVESIGHLHSISLAFSGKGSLRRSNPQSRVAKGSDFSAAALQISDLALLEIAVPDFIAKAEPDKKPVLVLGIVSSVGQTGMVTFHARFNTPIPGLNRVVNVSRLMSLVTFHRQIDALWSVGCLPELLLWSLLDPAEAWRAAGVWEELRTKDGGPPAPDLGSAAMLAKIKSLNLLNESQAAAISQVIHSCSTRRLEGQLEDALGSAGSLTLIQGPPGTGKTSTIVSLLSVLLASSKNNAWRRTCVATSEGAVLDVPLAPFRILVCAPSNAAVDEIMLRVAEKGLLMSSGNYATPRIVRVGGGTTVDALNDVNLRTLAQQQPCAVQSSAGDAQKENRKRLGSLLDEMQAANSKIGIADKERRDHRASVADARKKGMVTVEEQQRTTKQDRRLTDRLSKLHNEKNEIIASLTNTRQALKTDDSERKRENLLATARVINAASIVFSTLSSAGHDDMNAVAAAFDVVIIDEAAQCGEPDVLIPITGRKARSPVDKSRDIPLHCVLVGDPKQLPATVLSTTPAVEQALGKSLFERMGEVAGSSVHMLRTQYRMHPEISRFSSEQFYNRRLVNGANVKAQDMHKAFHFDARKRFGPLTFLDTSVCRRAGEERTRGGSVINRGEAHIIVMSLVSLMLLYRCNDLRGKIAVLSPYRRQVLHLRDVIGAHPDLQYADIEVSTIDGIQGREKSIIFLSTVRSGTHRGIGFVDDSRRLNVAITRAKHALVIVGNATALSDNSATWASLIWHCAGLQKVIKLPLDPDRLFPEARNGAQVPLAPPLPPLEQLPDLAHNDGFDDVANSEGNEKICDSMDTRKEEYVEPTAARDLSLEERASEKVSPVPVSKRMDSDKPAIIVSPASPPVVKSQRINESHADSARRKDKIVRPIPSAARLGGCERPNQKQALNEHVAKGSAAVNIRPQPRTVERLQPLANASRATDKREAPQDCIAVPARVRERKERSVPKLPPSRPVQYQGVSGRDGAPLPRVQRRPAAPVVRPRTDPRVAGSKGSNTSRQTGQSRRPAPTRNGAGMLPSVPRAPPLSARSSRAGQPPIPMSREARLLGDRRDKRGARSLGSSAARQQRDAKRPKLASATQRAPTPFSLAQSVSQMKKTTDSTKRATGE